MSFYSKLAKTASRLLADKGQSLVFTRIVPGAFDPILGEDLSTTTLTYGGKGAIFDYNKSEIDGDIIQKGDGRLILEAVTTPPENNDTTIIDNRTYRVMNVKPTSPAGTVVIYEIQLRR